MYTAEELEKRRNLAKQAQCTASDLYWNSTAEELTQICNGVGPEYFPDTLRDIISWIYRNIAAAADIHDCRYEESDGTEEKRTLADLEFLDNSLKLLQYRYGKWRWFCPMWYLNKRKAYLAYDALREWGGKAWEEAYEKKDAGSKQEPDSCANSF